MSFDFFICYNKADKKEADWTGLTLEKNDRYKVFLPDWDIQAGENDVIAIENAISTAHNQKRTPRVIVILTENFINASPREMVWTFFRKLDPDGTKKRLIPLIFSANKHYDFPSSLNIENAIDLTKFDNDRDAEDFFLNAISGGRNKPKPDEKPALFSSISMNKNKPNENTSVNQSNTSTNSPITAQSNLAPPFYTLGQIDRIPQADHAASIIQEVVSKKAQLTGFILLGLDQEWPEGFKYKLAYILKEESQPIIPVDLLGDIPIGKFEANTFLWKIIGKHLDCEKNQAGVKKRLEEVRESYLFSRITTPEEITNPHFLIEMLTAWSNLQLSESAYNHYLLFICKTDYVEQPSQSLFSFFKSLTNQSPNWREKVAVLLKVRSLEKYLMPELESPRLTPDIDRWLDQHIKDHRLKNAIRLDVEKHYTNSTQGKPLKPIVTILDPLISNYLSQ